MLDSLLNLDSNLFVLLNSLGSPKYDFFWMVITNKMTNISVYLMLSIFFLKKNNIRDFIRLIFLLGLLILITDQMTNFFKYFISRPRPCHDQNLIELIRLVKSSCGGQYGFFSGHASNSFALAIFFSNLLFIHSKKISFFLVSFASLVAYSRIYIGVHYPLDIVFGALFGSINGYIFFYLWKKYTFST
ncbi:MAG: phosphatase PAP2 family protein [Flavobacteriaceae bacterium]|nr:phosphatase PAP2 family protein [Flavobacteriaceae bacterium]|tara:strand:- start:12729 stop:13292 length:564 start_codon:yes stop_codon:yes gene_type:complete